MKYDPINILWIEDNPLQNALYGKQINERSQSDLLDQSFNNDRIPAVFFNDENRELHKFFSLKLLQHPEEIREYVSACLEVEDKKGAKALGNTMGAIPEIIVFDYKLLDGIDLEGAIEKEAIVPYISDMKPIREILNPTFEIYKNHQDIFQNRMPYFEDSDNHSYHLTDFIKRINGKIFTSNDIAKNAEDDSKVEENSATNSEILEEILKKDESELVNDQLGLFAGVVISRLFKEHSSIAIPATFNHPDISRMHISSKFFEWINGYDLGDMFGSNFRGEKDWDKIIPHGIEKLRIRIEQQVKSGKVIPNYEQLVHLSSSPNIKEGIFSFTSIYGDRHLPLQGLFIGVPEEIKIEKIKDWANNLIKNLPKNNADIDKATQVSETLWNTYIEHFEERILLSDYTLREDSLNDGERNAFEDIKKLFCDRTDKIKKSKEVSIDSLFSSKDKIATKRLAVLLTVAKAWIQLEKCKKNALPKEEYAQIDKEDYIYMLFPLTNTIDNLLLPMHKDKAKNFGKFDKSMPKNLSLPESLVITKNWYLFNEWILPGERRLINSVYFKEKEFLPNWLQQV